ncbi:MAG: dTDP-4-amino-4,6-dideoxygalactose transaminase [Christensenellales bacterium]|nr:dTDP-4-amino-4,6-dideoxygalactose transaminase [Christensenellales bacterium]
MLPFNIPPYVPQCSDYVTQVIQNRKICGDGPFTARCNEALEALTGAPKALLTTSGTSALEMAAILLDIQPGDEVIMPSFTFVSTANAFALRGAKIVFVDVQPDTMNLDPLCVRAAITQHTRAIVPVHYAGVCCDMDALGDIAREHGLAMVEDAAQAVGSFYKDRPAGSMSDVGCFSFHETKNYSMGEGGAVILNDPHMVERAEIIREKGTDRSRFYRGQVDKYTWVDIGSSFLPSELNAAYLLAQLEQRASITAARMARWEQYDAGLAPLEQRGLIERMKVPADCVHNAHMYYIKLRSLEERSRLIAYLAEHDICAVFHYVPLHSATAGLKYGRFVGEDRYTTVLSERLLRLPMFYELTEADCARVIETISAFFDK